MDKVYLRPLQIVAGQDAAALIAAGAALPLAGGGLAFAAVERIVRPATGPVRRDIFSVDRLPSLDDSGRLERLTASRPPLGTLTLDRPRLMGIVNVTPDSFSDGGRHAAPKAAIAYGRALVAAGAEIVDIGGESTRPGAEPISSGVELARVLPVIAGLAAAGGPADAPKPLLSIDSRNAAVMRRAVAAGCGLVNDVSALCHDDAALATVRDAGVPVVLMHAQGVPATMQDAPRYDDVLLDVYDVLEARIEACLAAGIPRERLLIDPGIGFGKTPDDNIVLLRGLALFHGLGVPVLVGVSRKSFIGHFSRGEGPDNRLAGTLAANLHCAGQGAQILRVHDVAEAAQAFKIFSALYALPAPESPLGR